MKHKKINKWLMVLGALLTCHLAFEKSAWAERGDNLPGGIKIDDCTINENRDGAGGRVSATLRQALFYANQQDIGFRACRKSIIIDPVANDGKKEINLKKQLPINVKGTKDNGGYEIRGEGKVTLDFSSMTGKACAIKFKGTHSITLKNIAIVNAPGHALCFDEKVRDITLDNVEISDAGGSAIVIDEGAQGIKIFPNVSIKGISGNGIVIKNSGNQANIELQGTSRVVTKTNANGTVDFNDGNSAVQNLVMQSVATGRNKRYVLSEADAHILVTEMSPQGEGKFLIRGAVVKKSFACSNAVTQQTDPNLLRNQVQGVERIHVYAVDNNKLGTFLTYVGKQEDCTGESCPYGIGSTGSAYAAESQFGGLFTFILEVPSEINKIILVPELSDGSPATSSEVKVLGDINDRDTCEGVSEGETGGGNQGVSGSTGGVGGDIIIGFKTQRECELTGSTPSEFDSDGDGIKDVVENTGVRCQCSDTEFSCWRNPDTDEDGIPDGKELNGGDCLQANWGNDTLCDVDNDDKSNANDRDSDGDNINDYVEDRFYTFAQGNRAQYFRWNSGNTELAPYINQNGNTKDCTEWLANKGKSEVGAAYGIFSIKRDGSGDPQEYDPTTYDESTHDRVLLVCRNIGIRHPTNLNGKFDSDGETDLYNEITNDGDGTPDNVCRGQYEAVTGKCSRTCKINEIFQGMSDEYVDRNASGDAYQLKKEGDEYVVFKKEWQTIKIACSDIDQDGIPDCVENPEGSCTPCDNPNSLGQNLCPYKEDSDGDGKVDGISTTGAEPDKCPFTPGEECDQKRIYTHRSVLAFFLDRDRDNLRDGEEECPEITPVGIPLPPVPGAEGSEGSNAGGAASQVVEPVAPAVCRPDGEIVKIGGLGGRLTTETDPLLADTDNDTIDDYTEVVLWKRYTNPAAEDTDGDGLPDAWELEGTNASPIKEGGYVIRVNAGCNTFEMLHPDRTIRASDPVHPYYGTNPQKPDTDGDGIEDLKEVQGSYDGDVSSLLLTQLTLGIELVSNPLSKDSDGDGLEDGHEYDGIMNYNESNPCDVNTDHQGAPDNDPRDPNNKDACPADTNPNCRAVSGGGGTGPDTDNDGLPDDIEALIFDQTKDTDGDGLHDGVGDNDSDGDGLLDGVEDKNANGTVETTGAPETWETDPRNPNSDNDGLSDGVEKRLGTNPNDADTDKDCIPDGKEVNGNAFSSFTGTDTNPTTPDSDGDGLCDGNNSATDFLTADGKTVTCRQGEDKNCDSIVNKDANTGRFLETDPRLSDTDGDGFDDRGEACAGSGICANIGQATDGPSGGACGNTLYDGRKMTGPTTTFYLFGLLALLNRIVVGRMRKKSSQV